MLDRLENLDSINTETQVSPTSFFGDEVWLVGSREELGNYKRRLIFTDINTNFVYYAKIFCLDKLYNNNSVHTIRTYLINIKKLFIHLENNNIKNIDMINKALVNNYIGNIENKKVRYLFYSKLKGFFKFLYANKLMKTDISNLYKVEKPKSFIVDSKYINEKVIFQYDEVMKKEEIPLEMRVFYWIARLVPSRVTEIITSDVDFIKEYIDGYYTLTLNMFKQNGGYDEPEKRMIKLKKEGIAEYLYNIIIELKNRTLNIQEDIPDILKNKLFVYYYNGYTLLKTDPINNKLKKYAQMYNIMNDNNEIESITTHQLRHNAITDRINEGFTPLQIKDITHHKSTTMITKSYTHITQDNLKETVNKVNNDEIDNNTFKGKIINSQEALLRLKNSNRSQSLGRMGICSDSSNCKSDMINCLSCPFFVPNIEEKDMYIEQINDMKGKLKLYEHKPLMRENLEYKIKLFEGLIEKIDEMIKIQKGGNNNE